MKFSQRIGKTPIRQSIQIESIDSDLANGLWNNILNDFFDKIDDYVSHGRETPKATICKFIWTEFFKNRTDEISSYTTGNVYTAGFIEFLKKWFFIAKWYEKYDLLEFLSLLEQPSYDTNFIKGCNQTLIKESSGYRIIDNKVVQITSEEEIVAIEEAINSSSEYKPVEIHLRTSLEYLSNRENPDYRNSIKESISAVESLCIILTGDNNSTLGKALIQIEKKYKIHGALKNAFSSLYGYTSDSGGIRHSLLEDNLEVTLEDAKFMLVTCSAFINFLKVKI